MAWSAHDRVGSYRLLSLVGTGRSCQVWEAINDTTHQRLALKILSHEFAEDKEQVAFLKHEYGVGHGLSHPNVMHIYEFGVRSNAIFLAMDLFAAQNVKQLILQGVEEIAYLAQSIAEQSAAGLGYLHSRGWVHRDVKPDNFLINKKGEVKLIDFALAERSKGFLGKLLSKKSKIQGTRSYMSPEQIRGRGVDPRSDIYSLGCMLYELIGGKPPFTGQSTQELLTKHLTAGAPAVMGSGGREVTPEFSQLLKKMIAKKPQDRPPSMDDVVSALRGMKIFHRTPQPSKAEKKA